MFVTSDGNFDVHADLHKMAVWRFRAQRAKVFVTTNVLCVLLRTLHVFLPCQDNKP